MKFLTKTALKEATQWIKKESEAVELRRSKSKNSWFVAIVPESVFSKYSIDDTKLGLTLTKCFDDEMSRVTRFVSILSFKGCTMYRKY